MTMAVVGGREVFGLDAPSATRQPLATAQPLALSPAAASRHTDRLPPVKQWLASHR
jgi:hypothetical protein